MKRFIPPIALAVISAGLVASDVASSQEFPGYAQRCTTEELRPMPGFASGCEQPFATFGLSGPTVMPAGEFDVETTGSIKQARDNIHGAEHQSK